ncbi:MAG: hypothetical protein EXQ59_02545 [Acidobacteria bacterium]|nr:hypothetical protein [Acidobacteriota bacterium]
MRAMPIALFLTGTAVFGQTTRTYAHGAGHAPGFEQAGSSQEPKTEPSATLRVFLDCLSCDEDFLRTEVTLVDFVRDQRDAQVHILVTTRPTGEGTEYTLAFIGLEQFTQTNLTLRYASSGTDTADEVRRAIARRLLLGLAPYVAGTTLADQIEVTRAGVTAQPSAMTRPENDPWRFWVFRATADANLDVERSRQFLSVSGAFSADRTTDIWKIRLNARGTAKKDEFDFGNSESFENTTRDWNTTMLAVRSLGNHGGGRDRGLGGPLDVPESRSQLPASARRRIQRLSLCAVDEAPANRDLRSRRERFRLRGANDF